MSNWPRRVIRFHGWVAPAAVCALLLTSPALGAGRQSSVNRQSQEKAARKACLTGDYATGVSILADLFVEHTSPVYVYNQGRCLEQNSRYKDAIARFEEFLRIGETSPLDPADRTSAEKHIEDCKAKLAEETKSQVVAPQPVAQPVSQPEVNPPIVEKLAAEPQPPKSERGLVVGGIVTGGVGVAAVVAGVVFNLKANSLADEMQNTIDAYTASKNSSQQSYKTLAWVGYGVGAACIVAGAVLIAVGASRNGTSNQTNVALVPTVAPGQAGLLLHGGF
jgi:hypothetical protein